MLIRLCGRATGGGLRRFAWLVLQLRGHRHWWFFLRQCWMIAHQRSYILAMQQRGFRFDACRTRYYLQPLDLIPEMTQGLAGLLDDSYLVIRTLQSLDRGPEPFLDWDLAYPARFLGRLIGAPIAQRLDQIVAEAMDEVSARFEEVWRRTAHRA